MNIPRFVSRTPPPLPDNDEEDEDEEFGNYVIGGVTENGTGSFFGDSCEDSNATVYNDAPSLHASPTIKKNISKSAIFIEKENQEYEPSSSSPPPQPTKDDNFTVAFQLESEVTNSSVFTCDNGLPELLDNDGFEEGKSQRVEDISPYETVLNNHINSDESYASEGFESVTHLDVDNRPSSFVESVTAASSSTNGPLEIKSDNLVLRNEREEDVDSSSESPSFTEFSSIGISDGVNACASVESATEFTLESPTCVDDAAAEREDDCKYSQLGADEEDEFSEFADFQSNDEWQSPISFAETNEVAEIQNEPLFTEGEPFEPSLLDSIDANLIWNCLRFLEDTPALKYQWLSSASNYKLLSSLKIDSRNIFCGPWSKAMKSKRSDDQNKKYSPNSTIFPFGESSVVHHESCHLNSSPSTEVKAVVPNAHFDWEGSGLVNPFDSAKDDQIQIPQCDIGNVTETPLSSEILHIIQSLPDLSYMTKTYLIFKKLPT